jgi:multidrug efflux system outer membrane protein
MKNSIALSLVTLFILSGCSMAPELKLAKQELPAHLSDMKASVFVGNKWWEEFHDEKLNTLIEKALLHNDDFKLAISHVTLARASLGLSEADLYPTVDLDASAYRQKTTAESISPLSGKVYNDFSVAATASYEFDFWGKVKNQNDAAKSELIATEADKETIRISVVSSVAELYFNLISIENQIRVTSQTSEAYKESYEYRLKQFEHGAIDELILQQAKALYANSKLSLASLEEKRAVGQSALALLVGESPKIFFNQDIQTKENLPKPLDIPSDIHSNLLEQRPDIEAASQRVVASNAQIGVAKAAYFPSISLMGTAGYQSADFDKLMNGSAGMWGFGPSVNIPLLNFGRIDNEVNMAEARKDAASIAYAKVVKNAFKEVYDVLQKIKITDKKLIAQDEEMQALEKVLILSQKRFDNGYGTYLEVIEAKRALLNSKNNKIAFNTELIINQITLCKALGGGYKAN